VAFSTLLVIPILPGFERLTFRTRPPFGLKVQEHGGQLQISWNPVAASGRGKLDIFDGAEHTTVFISGNMSNATYAPRTAQIDVRLAPLESGKAGLETICYVRYPPPAPAPMLKPPPSPPKSRHHRTRKPALIERPSSKVAYFFR
jgi:hypothetical protein